VNEAAATALWESPPPLDRVVSERMEEDKWVFVVRVVAVDSESISERIERDPVSLRDDDIAVAVSALVLEPEWIVREDVGWFEIGVFAIDLVGVFSDIWSTLGDRRAKEISLPPRLTLAALLPLRAILPPPTPPLLLVVDLLLFLFLTARTPGGVSSSSSSCEGDEWGIGDGMLIWSTLRCLSTLLSLARSKRRLAPRLIVGGCRAFRCSVSSPDEKGMRLGGRCGRPKDSLLSRGGERVVVVVVIVNTESVEESLRAKAALILGDPGVRRSILSLPLRCESRLW